MLATIKSARWCDKDHWNSSGDVSHFGPFQRIELRKWSCHIDLPNYSSENGAATFIFQMTAPKMELPSVLVLTMQLHRDEKLTNKP
jgi:hypothetical protein